MEKNITIYVIRPTICYEEGDCYVGSTKFTIEKRFRQHKSSFINGSCYSYSKKLIEKYGQDLLEIVELEKCCENERYERERYWIEKIPNINKNVAGRNHKESSQEWKKNNPDWWKNYKKTEKYKQLRKEYLQKDGVKQKLVERTKKYYEENKDKLTEKFNCDCGGKYTKAQFTTHTKTKIHQNFLNNNVVFSNHTKESDKNKCFCGGIYTNKHKTTHSKTKLHQEYLKNNNVVL